MLIKIGATLIAIIIASSCSVEAPQAETVVIESRAIETEPTETVETIPAMKLEEAYEIPEGYENAHIIWEYLKDQGYSDYVTAGIMGNMMAEVGGGSLYLPYDLYSSDGYYYGLCQWNKGNYGAVHGESLEYQLEFLMDTIEQEFDYCGAVFDCSYEDFKSLEDEQLVARRFAQIYERCDSSTYWARQENATEAYNYFTEM